MVPLDCGSWAEGGVWDDDGVRELDEWSVMEDESGRGVVDLWDGSITCADDPERSCRESVGRGVVGCQISFV